MITNQAFLFFIFVINGIIIGTLFDMFRILRISFKTKDIVTYIEDILFWIFTGIIILYSIFVFNNGEIRLFIFIGIIIGIILYMTIFSEYIIKFSVYIIKFLKLIIGNIIKIVTIPFLLISRILKRIFFKPISFITINIKKITNKMINKLIKKLRHKNTKLIN